MYNVNRKQLLKKAGVVHNTFKIVSLLCIPYPPPLHSRDTILKVLL